MKKLISIVFSKTFIIMLALINVLLAVVRNIYDFERFLELSVYFIWGNVIAIVIIAFFYSVWNMFND